MEQSLRAGGAVSVAVMDLLSLIFVVSYLAWSEAGGFRFLRISREDCSGQYLLGDPAIAASYAQADDRTEGLL